MAFRSKVKARIRSPAPALESRLLNFLRLFLIGRAALMAENRFLRKQLALFQERKVRPRNASASTRLSMLALARFFEWRMARKLDLFENSRLLPLAEGRWSATIALIRRFNSTFGSELAG